MKPADSVTIGDVERYSGQVLPQGGLIALIANDALGNFVVTTPLLQMLREQLNPGGIHLYSGSRVREFGETTKLVEAFVPALGMTPRDAVLNSIALAPEGYDLVLNVEESLFAKSLAPVLARESGYVGGPSMAPDSRGEWRFPEDDRGALWADRAWIAPDITQRYPFLESGFIGEIFARLCYLTGPMASYSLPSEVPAGAVPDVLLATAASLQEKLWPAEKWLTVIDWLHDKGLTVGLVGAKPSTQKQFWVGAREENELVAGGKVIDLRGAWKLPSVVGALGKASLVLTIDNGILHMAVASGAKTVGLFRNGIHRLWAPPYPSLHPVVAPENGIVADVPVDAVISAISPALAG